MEYVLAFRSLCVSVWASHRFHNFSLMSKIAWKMKQNPRNQLFTLILGRLLSVVAKVSLGFHSVSFVCWVSFEKNKSLCHEIVFLSCQNEVCAGRFIHPHPPTDSPQRSVNLKTDRLPGYQLRPSWTCARQDSNCNLLCEQNWGAVNNWHCRDDCKTQYGGGLCILLGWDQKLMRCASAVPVDNGERERKSPVWFPQDRQLRKTCPGTV